MPKGKHSLHCLEPELFRAIGLVPCEGVSAWSLSAGLDEEAIYLLNQVVDAMGSFLKRSCTQFKGILYIELRAKTSFSTQRFLPCSPENQEVAGREFSSLAFIFVFPGWIKGTWKDEVNPWGEEEVPGGHRTQGLNCLTDNFSLFSWKAKLYAKSEPPHISSLNGRIFGKTRWLLTLKCWRQFLLPCRAHFEITGPVLLLQGESDWKFQLFWNCLGWWRTICDLCSCKYRQVILAGSRMVW